MRMEATRGAMLRPQVPWDVVVAAVDTSEERKEGPGFFLELATLMSHHYR